MNLRFTVLLYPRDNIAVKQGNATGEFGFDKKILESMEAEVISSVSHLQGIQQHVEQEHHQIQHHSRWPIYHAQTYTDRNMGIYIYIWERQIHQIDKQCENICILSEDITLYDTILSSTIQYYTRESEEQISIVEEEHHLNSKLGKVRDLKFS